MIIYVTADDSTQSEATTCGNILVILSWIVVILTMPFSLFVCFKVRYLSEKVYHCLPNSAIYTYVHNDPRCDLIIRSQTE